MLVAPKVLEHPQARPVGRIVIGAACGRDHDERRILAAREVEHAGEDLVPHFAAADDDERAVLRPFDDGRGGRGDEAQRDSDQEGRRFWSWL